MITGIKRARKIRSDARLEQLDAAQREQLRIWLEDENRSYTDVAARVRQEFGLSVGRTAVSAYYQRHLLPEHHDEKAEVAAILATRDTGCFDAATVNRARMLAFSTLVHPQPDIETTAKLLEIVRRAEKQQIAAERLELEKQRVALRQKELALRSRRQPRAGRLPQATTSTPTSLSAKPVTTSNDRAPSQKTPQNPPLYSGYFGLSRPHSEAQKIDEQPGFTPPFDPSEIPAAAASPATAPLLTEALALPKSATDLNRAPVVESTPAPTAPVVPFPQPPLRTSPLSPWSESSQTLRAA